MNNLKFDKLNVEKKDILIVKYSSTTTETEIAVAQKAFSELAAERDIKVLVLPEDMQVTKLDLDTAKTLKSILDRFIIDKQN